ncbi:hypothetical protein BH24GEM1_BH24GEM1_20200 [soil metagenome]
MSAPTVETERADRFAAFLRRLAEIQAYALSGDNHARMVVGEYGLARWCGCHPEKALAIAEDMAREEA